MGIEALPVPVEEAVELPASLISKARLRPSPSELEKAAEKVAALEEAELEDWEDGEAAADEEAAELEDC